MHGLRGVGGVADEVVGGFGATGLLEECALIGPVGGGGEGQVIRQFDDEEYEGEASAHGFAFLFRVLVVAPG